jgi:glutathione S-transferase
MKLYYSPGACSLSPHIVALELGLPVTAVKADIRKKVLENGESFLNINPKGQVPTLQLENGEILTEGVAIVQYFASLAPEKKMIPEGFAKFHQLEWLNFITTELHKGYSPLFRDNSEEVKTSARANILSKFNYLETALAKNTYLMGDTFTCADAYLFTVLSWSAHVKIELPQFIQEYLGRVSARPAVQAAMKAEGLIK